MFALDYANLSIVSWQTGSVLIKMVRISEIDNFVIDQCWLTYYAWLHNSIVRSTHVRALKLFTFATLRRSPNVATGPEFAAKLFKYSSVHLCLIFVWTNVMTEYAKTYKLYNNDDMGAVFVLIRSYF